MKKFFISLNLIVLFFFFAINEAYCKEDFFLNSKFENSKEVDVEKKEKKSIFSKIKKSKGDKEENIGYYGTLPDISKEFAYKKQPKKSSSEINAQIIPDEEIQKKEFKSAPFDDALFLDVIVKEQKPSNYVNDLQKTKFALNNLKKCIEEKGDIQRFNGCVNMIDLLVQNLKKKYGDTKDSYRESYSGILSVNHYSKVLGNLMYDANYYSKYIPITQTKYSKENILNEQEKLLTKINKALFLINNEN